MFIPIAGYSVVMRKDYGKVLKEGEELDVLYYDDTQSRYCCVSSDGALIFVIESIAKLVKKMLAPQIASVVTADEDVPENTVKWLKSQITLLKNKVSALEEAK